MAGGQRGPLHVVAGQGDRAAVGGPRFIAGAEAPVHVGAGAMEIHVTVEAPGERFQQAQSRGRPLGEGNGDGAVELDDRRAGQLGERVVQPADPAPVLRLRGGGAGVL